MTRAIRVTTPTSFPHSWSYLDNNRADPVPRIGWRKQVLTSRSLGSFCAARLFRESPPHRRLLILGLASRTPTGRWASAPFKGRSCPDPPPPLSDGCLRSTLGGDLVPGRLPVPS